MLDQEDGNRQFIAQPPDERHHLHRLARVHARGRLIQQQEFWSGGQRARDFQPALIAVGQVLGQKISLALQADKLQQVHSLAGGLLLLPDHLRRASDRAQPGRMQARMHADQDILQRRHVREEPDVLVRSRDPQLGDAVRCHPVQDDAVEHDRAFLGPVEPGDTVEEGRLAGAVGSNHAVDGPFFHVQIQLVDGDETAEAFGQQA